MPNPRFDLALEARSKGYIDDRELWDIAFEENIIDENEYRDKFKSSPQMLAREGLGATRGITAAPPPAPQLPKPTPSLRAPRAGEVTTPITPGEERELSRQREARYLREAPPSEEKLTQRLGTFVSGTLPGSITRIAAGEDYEALTGFKPEAQEAFPYSKFAGEAAGAFLPLGAAARAATGVAKPTVTLGQRLAREVSAGAIEFGTQDVLEKMARSRETGEEIDPVEVAKSAVERSLAGAGFGAAHVVPALSAGRLPKWMTDGLGHALASRLTGATVGAGVAGAAAATEGASPEMVAANMGAFFLLGLIGSRKFSQEFKQPAMNSTIKAASDIQESAGVPAEIARQRAMGALTETLRATQQKYGAIYNHPNFTAYLNTLTDEIRKLKPKSTAVGARQEALERINLAIARQEVTIGELSKLKVELRGPEVPSAVTIERPGEVIPGEAKPLPEVPPAALPPQDEALPVSEVQRPGERQLEAPGPEIGAPGIPTETPGIPVKPRIVSRGTKLPSSVFEIEGLAERAKSPDEFYSGLISKPSGAEVGIPSYSKVGITEPGKGISLPPSSLKADIESSVSSIRYTEPSHLTNLDIAISNPKEYVNRALVDSQANLQPYVNDLISVTGLAPDVRIKKKSSAEGKIKRYQDLRQDISNIADYLGARFVVPESERAGLFSKIKQGMKIEPGGVDNFFDNPTELGYKGIHLKIRLPNGMLAEVQIHTPDSLLAATRTHKIYERWRGKVPRTEKQVKQYRKDRRLSQRISQESADSYYGKIKGIEELTQREQAEERQPTPILDALGRFGGFSKKASQENRGELENVPARLKNRPDGKSEDHLVELINESIGANEPEMGDAGPLEDINDLFRRADDEGRGLTKKPPKVPEPIIPPDTVDMENLIIEEAKIALGEDPGLVISEAADAIEDAGLKYPRYNPTRIDDELRERGFIDFRGKPVKNARQAAELAAAFRNPKMEFFQVMLVKNGKLLAHRVITSGMPDLVSMGRGRILTRLDRVIQKLQPDGVFLAHGHPSGFAKPSQADKEMTRILAQRWGKKLKGHIVTDHEDYVVLEPVKKDGIITVRDYPDKFKFPKVDYREGMPRVASPREAMSMLAKDFTDNKGYGIMFLDAKLNVLSIESVNPTANLREYIKQNMARFGSVRVVLVARAGLSIPKLSREVEDIITTNAEGKPISSLRMESPDSYARITSGAPIRGTREEAPTYGVQETKEEFKTTEETPIQRVVAALREAKPIRAQQEKIYTEERRKRLAKAIAAGEKPGEAGFYAQLGALKGELPKVEFETLRGKIRQKEIDELFEQLRGSPVVSEWEKISAQTGLGKIFGEFGGQVPTEGELKLLRRVFGSDLTQALLEHKNLLRKLLDAAGQAINLPRTMMASFDLSAPLRQGIFMVGRPRQFGPAFIHMFKFLASEKNFQALQDSITKRPTYDLMKESKLALTEIGEGATEREEAFLSSWGEKIPIIGIGVRASSRAHVGFLNKLRADVFDDIVLKAKKLGLKPGDDPALLNDLSKFINAATGRGELPDSLERAAVIFNGIFFSPRLMASRIQLLNPAFYVNLDPFVRKEALSSLFSFASIALTAAALAKLAGANVGDDPRSADFGKIKAGNTRIDPWGGFQQYIRLAAQLIIGELVSSTTGTVMVLGEGYKPMTRLDIVQRFFEGKESPIASFVTGLLRGTDQLGNKFGVPKEAAERFIPMVLQDIYDVVQEKGTAGIPFAVPAILGASLQTYRRDTKDTVRAYRGIKRAIGEYQDQGNLKAARELIEKNRAIMSQGKMLEPHQEAISEIKKDIEDLKKMVNVGDVAKEKRLNFLNESLKKRQDHADVLLEKLKRRETGP